MTDETKPYLITLDAATTFHDALALLQAGRLYRCNRNGEYEQLKINAMPSNKPSGFYLSVKTARNKPCERITSQNIWQFYKDIS